MGFQRKDTLESPLRREIENNKKKVEENKGNYTEQEYNNRKVKAGNQSFATKLSRKAEK
tara:strand:- start:244 stop:420 length:177 start_codon:yes stop_codon:yes gene_type:complete